MVELHFAPLQGYTDCLYRNLHDEIFGGVGAYYTPFIRIEHGELRKKDIRDVLPENDKTGKLIPQVIVKDVHELEFLVSALQEMGYCRIDINMGCLFPLQTKKGRGAGLLSNFEKVGKICEFINNQSEIDFSIKMRLGNTDVGDYMHLLPILNDTRLKHVTIHPRIATQQYKGELNMDAFDEIIMNCTKPLIYNGELCSVEDIEDIVKRYPALKGVMMGRGLLMRPTLAKEYISGESVSTDELLRKVMEFHNRIFDGYSNVLQGDSHLLMKMKTFWEYLEGVIGHKNYKLIKKAVSISKYNAVLSNI